MPKYSDQVKKVVVTSKIEGSRLFIDEGTITVAEPYGTKGSWSVYLENSMFSIIVRDQSDFKFI